MKTEIKIAGRIKGLLCLMLSMVMVFGMTMGVHAEGDKYAFSVMFGIIYMKYGNTDAGYTDIAPDAVIQGNTDIKVEITSGWTAKVYMNGSEVISCSDEHSGTYRIPAGTYTFSRTLTSDTGKLWLVSLQSETADEHTHTFEWRTIREASASQDGEEAYTCTGCGYVSETKGLSASGFLWDDMINRIANAKAGETVVIDAGLWYSFPKRVMESIAARRDITVEINIRYLQKNFKITIPKDTAIDTSCDWYGPEKLTQMFGRDCEINPQIYD